MSREFDIVIFGATGFTGLMMVRELALSITDNPKEFSTLKWAVAGRNLAKLDSVLEKVSLELGQDLSGIVKIQADVSEPESLNRMAVRTRIVVNGVGPYVRYGKPVVEACVRAGTHHLDISGEPVFVEGMQLEFDRQAQETRAMIISTAGWDSIPVDVGVAYLKKNFPGRLHSVDTYVGIYPGDEGYRVNVGTFESAINIVPDFLPQLRLHARLYKELLTTPLPKSRITHSARILPHSRPDINLPGINLLFPAVDKLVAERTQYYDFTQKGEAPVQVQTYANIGSWGTLGKFTLIGLGMLPFILFGAGRRLLTRYPNVFTWGYFSRDGPSRAQIDTTKCACRLVGQGWAGESNSAISGEPSRPFDKQMTVLISGRDPAYLATSTCIVQCALTIFAERERMPKGGVLTPGTAFRDTALIDRYQKREFTFEIIDPK